MWQHARTHYQLINSNHDNVALHAHCSEYRAKPRSFAVADFTGGTGVTWGSKMREVFTALYFFYNYWYLLVAFSSQPPDHVKHGQQANILLAYTTVRVFGRELRLLYICTHNTPIQPIQYIYWPSGQQHNTMDNDKDTYQDCFVLLLLRLMTSCHQGLVLDCFRQDDLVPAQLCR